MKKIYLSILSLFTIFCVFSQTATITSGTGNFSGNVGIGLSNYHASEHIYLESEIGVGNFTSAGTAINKIAFMIDPSSTGTFPLAVANFEVYLQNVASTVQTFTTGTYSLAGYTKVFDGTFNITANNTWLELNLSTPFVRTAGSNLQVLIIRNNGLVQSGYPFVCSVGNANNPATTNLTSRRYNGTTQSSAGVTSLTASGFRSAIQLIRTLSSNAATTTITTPNQFCHSTPQNISVTIRNAGSTAISAGTAPVTLTVTGANTFTSTLSNTTALAANATEVVTFSGINLNAAGNNVITAVVNLPGDTDFANDTTRVGISTLASSSTFPVIDGADASTLIFSNLRNVSGARNLWALNPSTSPTGAYKNADLTDSIYPRSGTEFYLFDSYSGTTSLNFSGILFGGCFALPPTAPGAQYNFSFWMTHDNSFATDLDSMYVVVSTDRGLTWIKVGNGYQRYSATATTPTWSQKTESLAAYAGQTILVGFQGVSKYGNVIAIEDIELRVINTLPVAFESFTGKREGNNNVLSWSTSFEQNNKGFEVLRSADGVNFSSIGFVASKNSNGNSTTNTNYTLADNKILAGTNYYQLKQIDKDGKTSLSSIVVLKSTVRKLEISSIYPNPASNILNVVISNDKEEKITLAITDVAGKVIKTQQTTTGAGSSNLSFNIQDLSKGTYMIRAINNTTSEMQVMKFVKQ